MKLLVVPLTFLVVVNGDGIPFGRGGAVPTFKVQSASPSAENSDNQPPNEGFMRGLDFGGMFKRYRDLSSIHKRENLQVFPELAEAPQGRNGEGFVLPDFGIPANFRGGFDGQTDFAGPFGGEGSGFANFLNSVNADNFPGNEPNARHPVAPPPPSHHSVPAGFTADFQSPPFKRETAFKRPEPVYVKPQKPKYQPAPGFFDQSQEVSQQIQKDFETPDFPGPEGGFDFSRFEQEANQRSEFFESRNQEEEDRPQLKVFDPTKQAQVAVENQKERSNVANKPKAVIRPIIPAKPLTRYEKPNFRAPVPEVPSVNQEHQIVRLQRPKQEERFRPIQESSPSSLHGNYAPIFDNEQEIITASPLPKRRFISPKRGQSFDVKLGAGFNTREGGNEKNVLRPSLRQQRSSFFSEHPLFKSF